MRQHQQTFHQDVASTEARLRGFLTEVAQNPPPLLDSHAEQIDTEVWQETDCLACANCCRTMSPVFTNQDIKRIATHFRMAVAAFKEKWLYKTRDDEWMNRTQPCPFLNLNTNRCSIYAIRPADCASFPHLTKKRMVDYMHVHKQNIAYCPATFKLVEKLMHMLNNVSKNNDV